MSALHRAADELDSELKQWNIVVHQDANMISVAGKIIKIDKFTTRIECRKILKDLLKQAKQKHFEKTQTSFL